MNYGYEYVHVIYALEMMHCYCSKELYFLLQSLKNENMVDLKKELFLPIELINEKTKIIKTIEVKFIVTGDE